MTLLIICCVTVTFSMITLFSNSETIIENLTINDELIMDSKSSTSSMYLDPEINKFGVYVIQIQGIKSPINV